LFFLSLKIGVDCWALAANMNNPVGGACIDVRFDFHDCLFPFLENLLLVAQPQFRALPAQLGPLFFNHG
jgi:hypothetical protein